MASVQPRRAVFRAIVVVERPARLKPRYGAVIRPHIGQKQKNATPFDVTPFSVVRTEPNEEVLWNKPLIRLYKLKVVVVNSYFIKS